MSQNFQLLTKEDLAEILRTTVSAISCRLFRRQIPPPMKVTSRKALWHPKDIEAFLETGRVVDPLPRPEPPPRNKLGRPRKKVLRG
jgi:hypothetical protein